MKPFFVLVSTVGLMLTPAWAQQRNETTSQTETRSQKETSSHKEMTSHKHTTAMSGTRFIEEAGRGGQAEVELGNLAQQKASSDDVKQFAARMVQDHSQANEKLKSIAQKEGVSVPTTLTAKDQALKDKLNGLSGSAFDKAYMEAMVKDHRHDVSEFQREANNATDPDLKSFASETLPTLQEHLKMARETLTKVGGTSTATRRKRTKSETQTETQTQTH